MIDKHDLMRWKTAGNIVECRMLDKPPAEFAKLSMHLRPRRVVVH